MNIIYVRINHIKKKTSELKYKLLAEFRESLYMKSLLVEIEILKKLKYRTQHF